MRILLASDLSAPAGRALDLVRSAAWPVGTTVHLCSVLVVHGRPALARAEAAEGVLTHA